MSGGSDRIVRPINARILACRIPDSQLEIVEGAGHLLLLDHAELCATSIAEFLAD
jgi:pimeloyl-ACP methyl ester carboxylesterase